MPLLTNDQIQKRFKLQSDDDVAELVKLQALGVAYGHRGVNVDSEEFDDDARFDIEHIAVLLDLDEDQVLRFFKAAVSHGARYSQTEAAPEPSAVADAAHA